MTTALAEHIRLGFFCQRVVTQSVGERSSRTRRCTERVFCLTWSDALGLDEDFPRLPYIASLLPKATAIEPPSCVI